MSIRQSNTLVLQFFGNDTKQARAEIMGVGWIEFIYVNTSYSWFIKSVDSRHNGKLTSDEGISFSLDDGSFHELQPTDRGRPYSAAQCGIPWENGRHYKQVYSSVDEKNSLKITTEARGGKNYIKFVDQNTDKLVRQQRVPYAFKCVLRLEDDGVYIDVQQ